MRLLYQGGIWSGLRILIGYCGTCNLLRLAFAHFLYCRIDAWSVVCLMRAHASNASNTQTRFDVPRGVGNSTSAGWCNLKAFGGNVVAVHYAILCDHRVPPIDPVYCAVPRCRERLGGWRRREIPRTGGHATGKGGRGNGFVLLVLKICSMTPRVPGPAPAGREA